MGEYYAVVRSTDSLAHYGVKGMKWGVRKALKDYNLKNKSYKDLVEDFHREDEKDVRMYKDLINRPFGKVRIRHNIGKKAHNFGKQEKLLHDLSDEIYRRQKQGRAKLPRK